MDARRAPSGLLLTAFAHDSTEARQLRRAQLRGELVRLRRGVYAETDRWTRATPEERALLHLRAFAAVSAAPPVFSHQSAALLHGLPLLKLDEDQIHISTHTVSGGRKDDGIRRHVRAGATPAVLRRGLLATDEVRTLYDLAATLPFPDAVVVMDAGLRAGASARALRQLAGAAGAPAARRVTAVTNFGSPLAESPGESLSRALMHQVGARPPLLQQEFSDRRGLIGRVDFYWPEARIVGEFDGRIKYGDRFLGRPEDRLWNEKLREDRLRALGLRVIRWIWADLVDPSRLVAVLRAVGLIG